ncbi:MAG: YbaK/EbsC family protein [Bacteroidetes bacterium]|nr:YbaK/EbsC family protein [Bacteroidota bacterium]MCL5034343.1 YbaK/EbsC family protein [Bacteroidota bacterium]
MGIDRVREHLRKWSRDSDILEFETSSATVALAAHALNVEPARIAKTISLEYGDSAMLLVTAGDVKIDNPKFKAEFRFRPTMLLPERVIELTGHAIGGVCPFGLKEGTHVFLDVSLKRFETVFPACGSSNSAIRLTCDELEEYSSNERWVDVCKAR